MAGGRQTGPTDWLRGVSVKGDKGVGRGSVMDMQGNTFVLHIYIYEQYMNNYRSRN